MRQFRPLLTAVTGPVVARPPALAGGVIAADIADQQRYPDADEGRDLDMATERGTGLRVRLENPVRNSGRSDSASPDLVFSISTHYVLLRWFPWNFTRMLFYGEGVTAR